MTWYYLPFISAPATPGWSSPSEESPAPWLTLSGTPTQRPLSWPGWRRRSWIRLLSGLTCAPSTLQRGVAAWLSSLPVSPASRSAAPAASWALTTTVGSGPKSQGSSATWNPTTCSWRTSQELFGQDLPMSSVILPTSGSMRSGVCSPRPPLVRPIDVNGSGLWPTARAQDGTSGSTAHSRADFRPTLKQKVSQWPTPCAATDSRTATASPAALARGFAGTLTDAMRMWPTPTARAAPDCASERDRNSPSLSAIASHHAPTTTTGGSDGKVLNPRFVEALMGLPNGWLTPSTSAATASCPSAPAKPGNNSPTDSAA